MGSGKNCWRALFCLILACGGMVLAKEDVARAGFTRPWVWGVDRLAFRRHVEISGPHNFFRLDLMQWQAEKGKPPAVNFCLHEPLSYGNFSRPVSDFFQFTVNGIPEKVLHLSEDSVRLLQSPDGSAGCEIFLNYDGARFVLHWYMRPDSALLHCRIRPLADSLSAVDNARMTLRFVPSTLRQDQDKKVLWDGVYDRQALSAKRVLEQNPQGQLLEADDQYIILQDQKLDGSGDGKGAGPCFVAIDFTPVQKATLKMANSWLCSLVVDLKPDFQEFHFALWQHKNTFSNAQFKKYFTENASLFQLE